MGGEAVIRFQPGPIFTGSPADYWAPLNWLTLDNNDKDLGSCGPLLVDVPGATPSALVVAIGKDGNAYLLDRNDLGGISEPVASSHLSNFDSSRRRQLIGQTRVPMSPFAPPAICCWLSALPQPIRLPS